MLFFFFSSRRRHTRCLSDWSSDVCSSDLKFAGGSFVLMPRKVLTDIIDRCHRSDVLVSTGGFIERVLARQPDAIDRYIRSEEHTSELQSLRHLVCRLLLEKKKQTTDTNNK